MPIAERTLDTLEFVRIRTQLAHYTAFAASRELALALTPSTERSQVRWRLALTSEARRLLDEHAEATIGGTRDIREPARRAARGGVLDEPAFLEIANTLRSSGILARLLDKLPVAAYPILRDIGSGLPLLPELAHEIGRVISDEGEVRDSASPKLNRLRNEIRTAGSRLHERLRNLVGSAQYAPALQEAIVTVRNGRYVVPVKAEKRRAIPGLVQDQSASGATLYIEPLAVVELNNRWIEAQLAEQEEVQRVLVQLSAQVGAAAALLVAGIEALALFDLALAQAKYAEALRCIAPRLAGDAADNPDAPPADMLDAPSDAPAGLLQPNLHAPLLLTTARHPLLDQASVVPLDIWLGDTFHLLLITGPNTGGKTVALKTVGLLALMAQAGLHIPAREPARLPVFAHIFADIGDEQSIEQNLSTFSSHMTNIISILDAVAAERQSPPDGEPVPILVLLDELGAGTDPLEGAALARVICEHLREHDCLAIGTTHYAELKAFAHNAPGVQNASVEFDLETLAPTYRLTVGLPGRSNALAIAARLGLDPALVERAQGSITHEEIQLEQMLATIHQEREQTEQAMQEAETLRADAAIYRDRLAAELRRFEDTRDERIAAIVSTLEGELEAARSELRRLRNEPRSATLARQWAEEAEQHMQGWQRRMGQAARAAAATEPTSSLVAPPTLRPDGTQAPRPLQVGDAVLVRSVGLPGEILTLDDEDATAVVQVGGFRMEVGLDELRRTRDRPDAPANEPEAPRPREHTTLPPLPEVALSLDIRGRRAADVSDDLDRYLNDAYLAGLPSVRLIHGKGGGVLRQVVRDMLKQHPLVQSFQGGGAEGGEGVTIARLTEQN